MDSVLYPNKTLLYPTTAAVAGATAAATVSKLKKYKNPSTIVIVVAIHHVDKIVHYLNH